MIKFINYIIKYFIKQKKEETTEFIDSEELLENVFSIHFVIKEKDVDIFCDLSYTHKGSISDISDISEKYAQILVSLNYGLLKPKIIESLKLESKESEDNNKILLIDNIISFYDIYKTEMTKNSALYHKPLISPLSVFGSNQ